MRNYFRLGTVAALLLLCAGFAQPAAAVDVKVVKSPKGITAWLVQDRAAPVIHMAFAFRPGALRDPAGKEGLTNLMATLIDEGAGDLDSLAFQRKMESLAMTLSVNAGRDTLQISLRTLARNKTEAFKLLGLALSKPRFDPEPVERARAQIQDFLRRDMKDPDTIAFRDWMKEMYPKHPYGRTADGTPDTLAKLTVEDLRAIHKATMGRDNLVIGVVGDISPEELATLLDLAFGDLPEKSAPIEIKEVQPAADGSVQVQRMSIPQSVVMFGHGALHRDDPDFYAAMVMNHILGGGTFSSRLYTEVREKRGLAYSVYSFLNPYEKGPLYMGRVATENARVKETIDIIRREWKHMAEGQVTEEDVASAKTYMTGSYALRFASASGIARMLVSTQIDGSGIDYFDKRNRYIDSVTLADVKRVAARLLQADKLTFFVVGNPAGI
ncbi:MAG: insulinase family protein [Rhodospirillaceae bacterium]|nr:insulinase family protein [Rhodospirillaceae bacterium]